MRRNTSVPLRCSVDEGLMCRSFPHDRNLIDALIHEADNLKHRRTGHAAFLNISSTGAKL